MAQAAGYLICYDIADPRRLARIQRLISEQGLMIQYSVYLAWLTPSAMEELKAAIRNRINPNEDDVRIYALPQQVDVTLFRRQDEDVWLLGCGGAQALLHVSSLVDS